MEGFECLMIRTMEILEDFQWRLAFQRRGFAQGRGEIIDKVLTNDACCRNSSHFLQPYGGMSH